MASDSHNPLSLPEESPTLLTPRRPRKWSGMLIFLGALYLLTATNKEFQEHVGRPASGLVSLMRLIGLGIIIWGVVSWKKARPIRPRTLLLVGVPWCIVVVLAFLPTPVSTHVRCGNSYATQGEFEKAIDEFTKAIALNPKLAVPYYNRGNAYLHRKDPGKAITDYSQAIEIEPRDPQYYNNRGAAHLMAENYRAAVTDFTEAIRLDARLAQAYFGRSVALAELGETERSQADLAKARELDPKIGK